MNTSRSTSRDDTPVPSTAGHSSQLPLRRAPEDSDTIGEIFGNAYTFGSTDKKDPKAGTRISECDLVFLYSGDDVHPKTVVCTVHNWTGSVSS